MTKPSRLHLDHETYSDMNLLKVGSSRYSRDSSTELLMTAYRFDDGPKRQWIPAEGQDMPAELEDGLQDPDITKWAWNANFEININRNVLGLETDVRQWKDTMVMAMYCSLPAALDKAGVVVELPEDKKKMARGKALMRKFSMPRKPTKNDSRTRLFWYDALPEWEEYLDYNMGDVEAEVAIWHRLKKYMPSADEWENWHTDHDINSAGLPINMNMVHNAIEVYEDALKSGLQEMADISGLANPNSLPQLLPWLRSEGYPFEDCKAGHIKSALRQIDDAVTGGSVHPQEIEAVHRVLELRKEVSRTSIKKFDALSRATDEDGRLRFTLQFYGAQRTGRWAGRIYQPQNLPRPDKMYEKKIEVHAKNIEILDREAIELIYPNTFDLLASTLRPVVQAPEGKVLIDADLNAIENRVLGWLARCPKIMDVFENGRDPYLDFATYMFRRPYDELKAEYDAGDSMARTTAKPGVLGCLKGETPVLTHRGWKALVELRADDWLHDGAKWVRHDGVVFKGYQEVLCGSGIQATPDHRFLTFEGWEQWQQASQQPTFDSAIAMGIGVFSKGGALHGAPESYFFAPAHVVENESYQDQTSCGDYPHVAPDVLRLTVAPTSVNGSAQTFSTYSQIVSMLRGRVAKTRITVRSDTMGLGEFVCGSRAHKIGFSMLSRFSERTVASKLTELTTTVTTSPETSDSQHGRSRTAIADTWDILNTGDYARFAVLTDDGCLVAHNCGYMLGAGAEFENKDTGEIEATGLLGYAWNMGVSQFTKEQSELSVNTFRTEFSEVKDYWYGIERAMRKCIRTGEPTTFDRVRFDRKGPFVRMILPSGRALYYCRPRIEMVRAPWGEMKSSITYEGINDRKQWARTSTHPGKITENADQAISRDLLIHGVNLAMQRGLDVRLHVHDQIVAVSDEDRAEEELKVLVDCMEQRPWWALDLPLGSKGQITKVFQKD